MKDQFVPYQLALKLKELGFDEDCLAYFDIKHDFNLNKNDSSYPYSTKNSGYLQYDLLFIVSAPLWQQAFDFLKKKYKLTSHCDLKSVNHLGENYYFKITNFADLIDDSTTFIKDGYKSSLEAKIACLEQLIKFIS